MADRLTLELCASAPFALRYSATSGGGSGWPGSAVSFLVAAWDGPDESDMDLLRALNTYPAHYGVNEGEVVVHERGAWNVAPAATDTVTLSWSAPRHPPHHYSVYWMAGASFDLLGLATASKVLPDGLAQIPGNATSAVIKSAAAHAQLRIVEAARVVGATGALHLPGNRAHSFEAGATSVVLKGVPGWSDGTHTVSAVALDYTTDGEVTVLTLSGWGGGSDSSGGTCQYNLGPLCLDVTLYRQPLYLSLDLALELGARAAAARDYSGSLVAQSFAQHSACERVAFALAYGGMSAGALARLNKFAQLGLPVRLTDEASLPTPYGRVYEGVLSAQNNPGTARRWGDSLRFALDVERTREVGADRGGYAVRAVSTGAGGSFSVDGDLRATFPAGGGFIVLGSTNNDGPFAVGSSGTTYSASTDRTTVPVTGTVAATADGRIEVQGW